LLLLNANRTLAVDRIVDDLWGEDVPETAHKMVQVYVSRLRKSLPAGALHTRPPGYAVLLEHEQLDLHRFESLAAEARVSLAAGQSQQAANGFRDALSLWRGPALAEFASEPFAPTEAARLEELRMHALEGRLDADLELGRHGTLVGELEALIARYPLRDGLRRQHMLALYRSGRQAEALTAYHEARRALADELGIEPSAGLRELERRILEQDASLEVTISPPTRGTSARQGRARGENRLPERLTQSAAAPFVGRSEQLEHLTGLLDQTAAGQGALVVIAGEGGIGKTRLVAALAGAARQFAVLYGRCDEEMPPFGPWAEALTRHFAALSDGDLESLLDG